MKKNTFLFIAVSFGLAVIFALLAVISKMYLGKTLEIVFYILSSVSFAVFVAIVIITFIKLSKKKE